MGAVEDLLGSREFQLGFVCGTAALLCVVLLAGSLPSIKPRRRGLVGPALVLAGLVASAGWVGLHRSLSIPWFVVLGALLVYAGMELSVRWSRTRHSWWVRPLLLMPGAAIAAFGVDWGRPWWLPWMVLVGTCVCGPLTADFDTRSARLGLGPVMFAVALGGAYAYLPENDAIRSLLGAAIPLAVAGVPLRMARVGNGGSALVTFIFLWFVAREANNVPIQSWVMIFALGLMISEPIGYYFGWSLVGRRVVGRIDTGPWNIRQRVRSLLGAGTDTPTVVLQWVTIAVQVGLVLWVARVAGFSEQYPGDSARPLLLLLPVVAVGFLYGLFVGISPRFHYRRIGQSRQRRQRVRPVGVRQADPVVSSSGRPAPSGQPAQQAPAAP